MLDNVQAAATLKYSCCVFSFFYLHISYCQTRKYHLKIFTAEYHHCCYYCLSHTSGYRRIGGCTHNRLTGITCCWFFGRAQALLPHSFWHRCVWLSWLIKVLKDSHTHTNTHKHTQTHTHTHTHTQTYTHIHRESGIETRPSSVPPMTVKDTPLPSRHDYPVTGRL